jgi:hypothetical protein
VYLSARAEETMSERAALKFISLFVPSLEEAVPRYAALLGTLPTDRSALAPSPHPFAAKGPVAFELGGVTLALYECDGRTTHPGDVGFGIVAPVERATACVRQQGGQVFWGPKPVGPGGRTMAVGVLPDRHFFELTEPERPEATASCTAPSAGRPIGTGDR